MTRTRPIPRALAAGGRSGDRRYGCHGLLAAAALLVLPSGAAPAQLPLNTDAGMRGMMGAELAPMAAAAPDILAFGVVSAIGLADITAAEILGGSGPAVDMGTAIGGGWNPSLAGADVGGSAPTTAVQRSFDIIWAAWVRRNRVRDLVVQYELQGPNGTAGALVHESVSNSRIAVTSSATGPFVVARSGQFRLVVGGGIFKCDLTAAEVSGRYQGELIVTLSVL